MINFVKFHVSKMWINYTQLVNNINKRVIHYVGPKYNRYKFDRLITFINHRGPDAINLMVFYGSCKWIFVCLCACARRT